MLDSEQKNTFIQFDTHRLSYRPEDRLYGEETTAIVVGEKFYLLRGDHYPQLVFCTLGEALEYFKTHKGQLHYESDRL